MLNLIITNCTPHRNMDFKVTLVPNMIRLHLNHSTIPFTYLSKHDPSHTDPTPPHQIRICKAETKLSISRGQYIYLQFVQSF